MEELPDRIHNYSSPRVVPEVEDRSELVTLAEVERRSEDDGRKP